MTSEAAAAKKEENELVLTPVDYEELISKVARMMLDRLGDQLRSRDECDRIGIISVARGGLEPGQRFAEIFDIRFVLSVPSERYKKDRTTLPTPRFRWFPLQEDIQKADLWLIIDKLDDAGVTNTEISRRIEAFGGQSIRIAVFAKPENRTDCAGPNIVGREVPGNTWVVFPLEQSADRIRKKLGLEV